MARWYYRPGHPKANPRGFVEAADLDYQDDPLALNAPIMAGRFYENTAATDGTDIGSRRKRNDYMRVIGATDASDFSDGFRARVKGDAEREDTKHRREAIARAWWENTEGKGRRR